MQPGSSASFASRARVPSARRVDTTKRPEDRESVPIQGNGAAAQIPPARPSAERSTQVLFPSVDRPPDRAPRKSPKLGERLGHFLVLSYLGEGGMGEVSLCLDGRIGRDVAMKVAKAGHGSAAETRGRFLREARVQGQLEHPNIVPVYDIGIHRGETFFTMKRIGGHTLEEIVLGLPSGAKKYV